MLAIRNSPIDPVTPRAVAGYGITAEIIQGNSQTMTEYRFQAPVHLLAVSEEATRDEDESFVEGLPTSTVRTLNRKRTFVPEGHKYFGWHLPRTLARMVYFYFESSKVDIVADRAVPDTLFTPLFFFENTRLWDPS
jgi:AraC family transcriptional regulator